MDSLARRSHRLPGLAVAYLPRYRPRKGGSIEALEALAEEPLTETEFVRSGRGDGGVHLFYYRPKGYIGATYLHGIDIKLDTGYTILPPSLHPDSGMPCS